MAAAVSVVAVEASTRCSTFAKPSEMHRFEGKSEFVSHHNRGSRISGQGHAAGG